MVVRHSRKFQLSVIADKRIKMKDVSNGDLKFKHPNWSLMNLEDIVRSENINTTYRTDEGIIVRVEQLCPSSPALIVRCQDNGSQ